MNDFVIINLEYSKKNILIDEDISIDCVECFIEIGLKKINLPRSICNQIEVLCVFSKSNEYLIITGDSSNTLIIIDLYNSVILKEYTLKRCSDVSWNEFQVVGIDYLLFIYEHGVLVFDVSLNLILSKYHPYIDTTFKGFLNGNIFFFNEYLGNWEYKLPKI
ncbi:MAG: hypothetical protein COB02_00680 [Candidatus Cloacimonadota bacterium]|nr:MAG: hypothetical protein COB02_00680 [Candidatus Cloacimonadota bacterium]